VSAGVPEPLLTAEQVSELFQVSPKTIFRWAALGQLPAICLNRGRRNGCIRFDPTEIRKYIEARRVRPVLGGRTRRAS
jgi:predicted site-specific integrase-resolvase